MLAVEIRRDFIASGTSFQRNAEQPFLEARFVQRFGTTRYLGDCFDADTRIRESRDAQIVSSAVNAHGPLVLGRDDLHDRGARFARVRPIKGTKNERGATRNCGRGDKHAGAIPRVMISPINPLAQSSAHWGRLELLLSSKIKYLARNWLGRQGAQLTIPAVGAPRKAAAASPRIDGLVTPCSNIDKRHARAFW
ncbi:MAG: hypothetical protein M3R64_07625 [Pseudomonadota bacterium]|nr:hypothetical protein [Pseudomonadota bacterium]